MTQVMFVSIVALLSIHTNASDAVLKGNMVYDLCTGQIQLHLRGGRGDGNIPIRLAMTFLPLFRLTNTTSIP